MKTNNRPTIKVTEYEVSVKVDEYLYITEWREKDFRWVKKTGNTREVERPMYDTEYIEYLEKENQELKGKIALQQSSYEKEFRELNDKLLKVVESVFKEHRHSKLPAHPYPCDNCSKCGVILNNPNVKYTLPLWEEHLLQEIKSAMEKGKE